jgi:hypothetical protein
MTWNGSSDESTSISASLTLTFDSRPIPRQSRKRHFRQKKAKNKSSGKTQDFFKTKEGEEEKDGESRFEWISEDETEPFEVDFREKLKKRTYLYLADSKGFLKIWDLRAVLKENKIKKRKVLEKDKSNYNPRRKDIKNAESDVKYWRKDSETEELSSFSQVEDMVLVKEWQGHQETINSLRSIQDPPALISCSSDKFVKIWSRTGDLWGSIDLTTPELPKKWHFPFDWEGKRQADIQKVTKVLSMIEDSPDLSLKYLPAVHKSSKKKPKLKPEPKQEKTPTSAPKVKINPQQFEFESFDDEEDPPEKPQVVLKKTYASVSDLQRQLDEFDELRRAEYQEDHFELSKKHSKSRNRFEGESKKVEVVKGSKAVNAGKGNKDSYNRLPNIGSVKIRKREESTFNKTGNKTQFSQDKSIHVRRPIAAMGSTGFIKNFNGQGCKFRVKKEVNVDVRYQAGESIRVMNRAISTHNFNSVITPYTEDLKTLKKKNEILKDLVKKKLGKATSTSNFLKKKL